MSAPDVYGLTMTGSGSEAAPLPPTYAAPILKNAGHVFMPMRCRLACKVVKLGTHFLTGETLKWLEP